MLKFLLVYINYFSFMPFCIGWMKNFDKIALSCTVKEIEANLCFHFWLSSYYSVSYIAIITKTNPKQAIDLSNAHTKFGKDMSNIFP